MKKLMFSLFALCAIALYSCGEPQEAEVSTDQETVQDTIAEAAESDTDSTAVVEDSVKVDPTE
jgi:uncharacterized protein YcfL